MRFALLLPLHTAEGESVERSTDVRWSLFVSIRIANTCIDASPRGSVGPHGPASER
jgi:hypothetical protein